MWGCKHILCIHYYLARIVTTHTNYELAKGQRSELVFKTTLIWVTHSCSGSSEVMH